MSLFEDSCPNNFLLSCRLRGDFSFMSKVTCSFIIYWVYHDRIVSLVRPINKMPDIIS